MTAAGKILLGLLLAAPGWQWLMGVQQRNAAVAQAQVAARQGRWAAAAAAWQTASRLQPDPAVLINLGYAQLQAGYPAAARLSYSQLLRVGTPAAFGSVARQQLALLAVAQGSYVPALGLLREALRLDPRNAVARRNYERLQAYLKSQTTNNKYLPPPPSKPRPDSTSKPKSAPKPAPPTGGAAPSAAPKPRLSPDGSPQPQPENPVPTGTAGPRQPAPARPQPGGGPASPLPTGPRGGSQRGLSSDAAPSPTAPRARTPRLGSEAATPADIQLQTQRERLQALNLTPAQAHQLLETLRAQEQQYLQQVRRPAPAGKVDPKGPTW